MFTLFTSPIQRLVAKRYEELPVQAALAPAPVPPPAKAARPPKAPPPKAPPPKAAAKAPAWKGPKPSKDWQAERIVPWKPIRQVSRLEGSVWQKVSLRAGALLAPSLPEGAVDGLNSAFMCRASSSSDNSRARRSAAKQRAPLQRVLPQNRALQFDIVHAKLNRMGIHDPRQLIWVTGSGPGFHEEPERSPGSGDASGDGDGQLSGDALELMVDFLRLVRPAEARALRDGTSQAPSELFLQCLLRGVGVEIDVLQARVAAAMHIARFGEADKVEDMLTKGLAAVRAVMNSKAIPTLLEGVLMVGNYVNASSAALGGALGITLESLAQLAHTRCKRGRGVQHINALVFVVELLSRMHPDFREALVKDLDECRAQQKLDAVALAECVKALATQVRAVQAFAGDAAAVAAKEAAPAGGTQPEYERQVSGASMATATSSDVVADGEAAPEEVAQGPRALAPERLRAFLATAVSRVQRLEALLSDLEKATDDLRRWFAEPPESTLSSMLGCLARLRAALPTAPLPEPPARADTARPGAQLLGSSRRPRKFKSLRAKFETSQASQPEAVHTGVGPDAAEELSPAPDGRRRTAQVGSAAEGELPQEAMEHEPEKSPEDDTREGFEGALRQLEKMFSVLAPSSFLAERCDGGTSREDENEKAYEQSESPAPSHVEEGAAFEKEISALNALLVRFQPAAESSAGSEHAGSDALFDYDELFDPTSDYDESSPGAESRDDFDTHITTLEALMNTLSRGATEESPDVSPVSGGPPLPSLPEARVAAFGVPRREADPLHLTPRRALSELEVTLARLQSASRAPLSPALECDSESDTGDEVDETPRGPSAEAISAFEAPLAELQGLFPLLKAGDGSSLRPSEMLRPVTAVEGAGDASTPSGRKKALPLPQLQLGRSLARDD